MTAATKYISTLLRKTDQKETILSSCRPGGAVSKDGVNMNETRDIREVVKLAYQALDEKKASDITIIDISSLSVVADYFIIASADNIRQTGALADNVEEVLGRAGIMPKQIEGRSSGNWILLDYYDVIIHVFDKENRLFYDIERIWKDGRRIVDINEL